MRNRVPKRLLDAGITIERYMSLKWACREYDKMRAVLAGMRDPLRATTYGGDAGHSGTGDPTGQAVERLMRTPEFQRVMAITHAAIVTDAELYHGILENVCRGKAYWEIHPRPWCGERQFYAKCVSFFLELDKFL